MLQSLRLLDQIDLVLQDDDVLELHDLHRRQVLRRLGLRARLVASNEKEGGVHDRCAVQHRGCLSDGRRG